MTTHTPGLSALQLQRQLGIPRYETAWVMLHKLRRAMVRPDREPLHTEVEVDEAYVGGPDIGLRGGRELGNKAVVVAAVEIRGKGSGRVRLQVVPDASGRVTLATDSPPDAPRPIVGVRVTIEPTPGRPAPSGPVALAPVVLAPPQ